MGFVNWSTTSLTQHFINVFIFNFKKNLALFDEHDEDHLLTWGIFVFLTFSLLPDNYIEIINYILCSLVVLNSKFSGNETMDSIIAVYTEVIIFCYLIVFFVLDGLLKVEEEYTTHYNFDEELFKQNGDVNNQKKFNYFSTRYSPVTEAFLDIVFLTFPTVIIFYIVIPTLGFLYNKELNIDLTDIVFTIDVTGHQWYWSYQYHIDLFSYSLHSLHICNPSDLEYDSIIELEASENRLLSVDKMLVIPSYTVIGLSMSSDDVVHSWAVPQLGIKVDTVPGRVTTMALYTYIDGTFYGQCSELCGANHGFMPIVLESIPVDTFMKWYYEASLEQYKNFFDAYFNKIMK